MKNNKKYMVLLALMDNLVGLCNYSNNEIYYINYIK